MTIRKLVTGLPMLALLALWVAPTGALAVTASDCKEAWNDSNAKSSCAGNLWGEGSPEIGAGNVCTVTGYCRQHVVEEEDNWIFNEWWSGTTDPIDDTKSLSNCNGNLKVGNC